MKRIEYTAPQLCITIVGSQLPLAQSNMISNDGNVHLNAASMNEGDGGDAVKANHYNAWDDDWSQNP